ncbi:hypothetical protein RUESEDTHA_02949 [Ruegeria sp. THAF57]|nr:hypothetical protein RUESEDTHA_02949 [Ruegeria sp. THAF57]
MTSQYLASNHKIDIFSKVLKLKNFFFDTTIFAEIIFEKDPQGFRQ